MPMKNNERKPPRLLNLIALAAIGPMALNIFFPSMPGMMDVFDTDYGTVQLALTLYLVALAGAQLVVGPLSDRFGRRPIVMCGMTVCMAGSVVCIFAPTIEVLVFGRILQALGACTGIVMGRTIIRDLYGLNKSASMIGYLTMVMVVAPMVSPAIGAILEDNFNWQASFILVLFLTAIVLIISHSVLGETHPGPYAKLDVRQTLVSFGALLGQSGFNRHAAQISLSSAAFFSFLGGAPYISMRLMGLSGTEYGFYFMAGGFGYMIGNFITGRMSERWGADRMITLGTSIGLSGGIVLAAAYALDSLGPLMLFGCMGLIAFGNGLCLPSGTASAISADKIRIGAAAGLAGFMQMATGALASYLVGIYLSDTALPLVIIMGTAVVSAFVVNIVGKR